VGKKKNGIKKRNRNNTPKVTIEKSDSAKINNAATIKLLTNDDRAVFSVLCDNNKNK
jgi:hypothetical protein